MAADNVRTEPPSGRYRPLPTGAHGLDPAAVQRDQRERLEQAIVELIAEKGYRAVRIADLSKLSRVSQPTFYSLFADKEELFVSAYDDIAERTARTVLSAYEVDRPAGERLPVPSRVLAAMAAFAELAAAEPQAMSLLVLGAFGAGADALEHRNRSVELLERRLRSARSSHGVASAADASDLTLKVILGGVREVTATRLCQGREGELPALVGELSAWAASYPQELPPGLALATAERPAGAGSDALAAAGTSRRADRLPSGRSERPRGEILNNQRERIVDATAEIVAEKGLAALTIPEIARRANVSNQTFYEIYPSKHDAFLGAQKVGMHQALRAGVEAWKAQMPDWPQAIAAGLRAVIDYLLAEPAHAHLSIVDTFGASPGTIEIRGETLRAFAGYFGPGYEHARGARQVPAITAEAVVGGCWQVLHHYVENGRLAELPDAAPQLTFLLLAPFLGAERAADRAAARP